MSMAQLGIFPHQQDLGLRLQAGEITRLQWPMLLQTVGYSAAFVGIWVEFAF